GLAAPERPQPGAEADEELGDLAAGPARAHHVPGLVQHDRDEQRHHEQQRAENVHAGKPPSCRVVLHATGRTRVSCPAPGHGKTRCLPDRRTREAGKFQTVRGLDLLLRAYPLTAEPVSSSARALDQRSASSTASSVAASADCARSACSATTASIVSTIPVNGSRPPRNAATHASFAPLNTAGKVPPALPTCLARPTAGKACSSSGKNSQLAALVQSQAGAASATRCGQPMASAIGMRMSGGEACAMVEPSANSTMECTIDCGCTTTSIRSNGIS